MDGRDLTYNETRLASELFQFSVQYSRVKIHAHKHVFFQPRNSGMTPDGEIFTHGIAVSRDYALDSPDLQSFFIHEMVHVWQKQNGVLNPVWSAIGNTLRHGFLYGRAYNYKLSPDADLLDYRIEQQAQIIEDFFRIKALKIGPKGSHLQNEETGEELHKLFVSVLGKFLKNPNMQAIDKLLGCYAVLLAVGFSGCINLMAYRFYPISAARENGEILFRSERLAEKCSSGFFVMNLSVQVKDCSEKCERWFVVRSDRPTKDDQPMDLPVKYGATFAKTETRIPAQELAPDVYSVSGDFACYVGNNLESNVLIGTFEVLEGNQPIVNFTSESTR